MRSQIESGAELLARLNSKPSPVHLLEDGLFVESPRGTDVVEIGGKSATGKTLLLSRMLAKCILPPRDCTIPIDGCTASVVLINTDHHFQVSKLIEIMTVLVNTGNFATHTESNVTELVRNSLRNLRVIDCYDSEQLNLTLRTLDDVFLLNTEIALLALDSITAYYWQDREGGAVETVDSYVKKLLKLVKAQTTRFNVTTVYTRSHDRVGDTLKRRKFSRDLLQDEADYKIHLSRVHDTSKKHLCTLETSQAGKTIHYSIEASGIVWETDQGDS